MMMVTWEATVEAQEEEEEEAQEPMLVRVLLVEWELEEKYEYFHGRR